jgi:hypothetical protein
MPCLSGDLPKASGNPISSVCRLILAGVTWDLGPRCTNIMRGKFVAAVGVSDLVIVETEDALLITNRKSAQDVGKIVQYLDEKKLHKLV